ncbi:MAG: hypothetical protein AAF594_14585 [Bacteroidota bacterium]
MPFSKHDAVDPHHHWAVVWPDGWISKTASTRSDAITAFLKIWHPYEPDHRDRDWRRWKREGVRVVRVVTHALGREALACSVAARTRALVDDLNRYGVNGEVAARHHLGELRELADRLLDSQ